MNIPLTNAPAEPPCNTPVETDYRNTVQKHTANGKRILMVFLKAFSSLQSTRKKYRHKARCKRGTTLLDVVPQRQQLCSRRIEIPSKYALQKNAFAFIFRHRKSPRFHGTSFNVLNLVACVRQCVTACVIQVTANGVLPGFLHSLILSENFCIKLSLCPFSALLKFMSSWPNLGLSWRHGFKQAQGAGAAYQWH